MSTVFRVIGSYRPVRDVLLPPDTVQAQLLIAHPGHELIVHGWLSRTRPTIHLLTDGSGHSSQPRIDTTADFLREAGARRGAIFGCLSDAEAYQMILEGNVRLLHSIVMELAAHLELTRPAMVITDAAEGYNPVHDLCRLIAGAAIEEANVNTVLFEYAVINNPRTYDPMSADVIAFDLDDTAHAAKIEIARKWAPGLGDIQDLLTRYGYEAYRREAFRRVRDWNHIDLDAAPLYERFGEARLAAQVYTRVIRRDEHMIPLRDALVAEVRKRRCVF